MFFYSHGLRYLGASEVSSQWFRFFKYLKKLKRFIIQSPESIMIGSHLQAGRTPSPEESCQIGRQVSIRRLPDERFLAWTALDCQVTEMHRLYRSQSCLWVDGGPLLPAVPHSRHTHLPTHWGAEKAELTWPVSYPEEDGTVLHTAV